MDHITLAPVVLFVYNRLDHTKETIEALKKNRFAGKTILYIFSDGPKDSDDEEGVNRLRKYLHTVTGFKSVRITERKTNTGLADNIIDGVTGVVNKHGKVIVLEDDLVTSEFFLRYMNVALYLYQDCPKVMQISGFAYPVRKKGLPETFFLRFADCWGWATWKDRWEFFEKDPEKLLRIFTRKDIYHFNLEQGYDYWDQVKQNAKGTLNTWAVFWYAAVFKNGGYMLYPTESLVKYTGFDNSGVHCGVSDQFATEVSSRPVKRYPVRIEEHKAGRRRLSCYLRRLRPGILKKCFIKIRNMAGNMKLSCGFGKG